MPRWQSALWLWYVGRVDLVRSVSQSPVSIAGAGFSSVTSHVKDIGKHHLETLGPEVKRI
jgi:hypothetical protein